MKALAAIPERSKNSVKSFRPSISVRHSITHKYTLFSTFVLKTHNSNLNCYTSLIPAKPTQLCSSTYLELHVAWYGDQLICCRTATFCQCLCLFKSHHGQSGLQTFAISSVLLT